jgi:hypothetical protein
MDRTLNTAVNIHISKHAFIHARFVAPETHARARNMQLPSQCLNNKKAPS